MKKIILISGGSDGLGKAIATKLTSTHQVIILSPNREKLEQVSQEIGCDFVTGNVSDYQSINGAVEEVIAKYKKIDVLINNAGLWMEGDLVSCDAKKIAELINVNTIGTIYLTKAVLPSMRQSGGGRIINIISQDGLYSKTNRTVYSASKWAITGFTKCLEKDLSSDQIAVTGIYPGLLKTNLFAKQGSKRDLSEALDPIEIATLVEYVINLSNTIQIPEVGIKNINNLNNMDDSGTPQIGLDINPDLITPQVGIPKALTPDANNTVPTPTEPAKEGVIDITPGSPESVATPDPSMTQPVVENSAPTVPTVSTSLDQNASQPTQAPSDVIDITPGNTPADSAAQPISQPVTQPQSSSAHLSDIIPSSQSDQPAAQSTDQPPLVSPTPSTPVLTTPVDTSSVTPQPVEVELPQTDRSQLFEDPDQVSLNK